MGRATTDAVQMEVPLTFDALRIALWIATARVRLEDPSSREAFRTCWDEGSKVNFYTTGSSISSYLTAFIEAEGGKSTMLESLRVASEPQRQFTH